VFRCGGVQLPLTDEATLAVALDVGGLVWLLRVACVSGALAFTVKLLKKKKKEGCEGIFKLCTKNNYKKLRTETVC